MQEILDTKLTIDSVQDNEEEVAREFQPRYEEDDGKLENPIALAPSIAILVSQGNGTG